MSNKEIVDIINNLKQDKVEFNKSLREMDKTLKEIEDISKSVSDQYKRTNMIIIIGVILVLLFNIPFLSLPILIVSLCNKHFYNKSNSAINLCKYESNVCKTTIESEIEMRNKKIDSYDAILEFRKGKILDKKTIENLNIYLFFDKDIHYEIDKINSKYNLGISISEDYKMFNKLYFNDNKDNIKTNEDILNEELAKVRYKKL